MGRGYRWWITGLLLLAAVFRFHALFANSFHADEALFATFGRLIATWRDPLLQTQPVDKPPLLFYLQALFYLPLGPVEWAARLPNWIASLLLVPLTGRLVRQLYGDELAAVLAAALVALSPFTIQFSATAYTDPLLAMLVVAALVAGTRRSVLRIPYSVSGQRQYAIRNTQYVLTGILFGLAAATKYQAWLFLPLLLGLIALNPKSQIPNPNFQARRVLRIAYSVFRSKQYAIRNTQYASNLQSPISNLLIGLIPILLVVLLWEWARAGRLTLWADQITGYGGVRPVWSWELWPRASEWSGLWGYLLGSPVLSFGLLLAMPPFLALLIHDQDRPTALDQLFVLFLLGYFLLHWFVAVPVWERYILPAVPVAAVVLGRFASRLSGFIRAGLGNELPIRSTGWLPVAVVVGLIVVQLPAAYGGRLGRFLVGGQPAADEGAAEVAMLLADAPYGTVLYDHWYSWQWRYHLLDSGVYVSWFAHPEALARDLMVFGNNGQPRYLALPAGEAARPVRRAVAEAGFELRLVHAAEGGIELYRVVGEETR